ncbi:unnamed protein product [Rotaria sp. Silwood1]|nr:unnamed protein product [Rotaria sp. Silwood1]
MGSKISWFKFPIESPVPVKSETIETATLVPKLSTGLEEISLENQNITNKQEHEMHDILKNGTQNDFILDLSHSKKENDIQIDDIPELQRNIDIQLPEINMDTQFTNDDTLPIIWLDADVHESRENIDLQEKLKTITKSLTVFNADEECEEHIRQLPVGEEVILIVAGTIGTVIIPLVHDSIQIRVIYIYSHVDNYYKKKFEQYAKVRDVIISPDMLINNIHMEQILYQRGAEEQLSLNIYNQQEESSDLNDRFIWMYVFMNIFFRMNHSLYSSTIADEKRALLEKLCEMYNDIESLRVWNHFDSKYSRDQAIQWYTNEGLFYTALNRTLRCRNLKLLTVFRFFIFDLYEQLMQTYDSQKNKRKHEKSDQLLPIYSVYRRQILPLGQIQRMKHSIGSFASINSFFSTTRDRHIAERFRSKSSDEFTINLRSVLFKIDIDPNLNIRQYGDIQDISAYRDEKELLFIPGTIFQIKNVSKANDYFIELKLCSENDKEIHDIISKWKQYIESKLNQSYLYWFVEETDKLNHAEQYYRLVLKYLPKNDPFISYSYHGLGNIYKKNGKYAEAITYYTEARQISNDRRWQAKCYNSIADAYLSMDNEKLALHNYKVAKSMYECETNQSYRNIADCCSNIGRIYQKIKNYNKALTSFQEVLSLNEKIASKDSLHMITSLMNLAKTYCLKRDYEEARNYLNRALQMSQKHLKPNDPELGSMYKDIGNIYQEDKQFHLALSFYHKAAEIYYYTYPRTDQHNVDIQKCIRYSNYKLK